MVGSNNGIRCLSRIGISFIFLLSLYAQEEGLEQVTVAPTSGGKITVAVLDFEARGISEQEVQTLTERLRTEIGNTNAVRLIERKAVAQIMEEQGFQQTGCTSDECAVAVGALLGVQYMISGAIGKMGNTYTIDVKMFSVETGAIERTKSVTHEGEIAELLTEMEIMAWEIVGLDIPGRLRLKRAGEDDKATVAVLDFEGRGISMMEAQTLTDRFTTEMASTGKVLMVERGAMQEVLTEQGFETAACSSDECAAEVGAMLGVQFMVSGAIGKLGDTYTIDVKMFSVATGAAESMKNMTYIGKVDGLINEIDILAWVILGLDPPKELLKKQKKFVGGGDITEDKGTNWLLWSVVGLAVVGGGAYMAMAGGDAGAAATVGEPPDFPTVP